MHEFDAIRLIRRKAMLLAVLGILVSGVLVAVVTAVPIYQASREGLEESMLFGTEARATALGNVLAQYDEVARQATSRTEIRKRLAAHARGEMSLDDLVDYTTPRLADALDGSPSAVGIARLTVDGDAAARIGETGPTELPDKARLERDLVTADGRMLWRVAAPIVHDGEWLGEDVMFFEVEELRASLDHAAELAPEARAFLREAGTERVISVTGDDPTLSRVPADLIDAVTPSEKLPSPTLGRFRSEGKPQVFIAAPLPGQGWSLVVDVPFWTFYRPMVGRLLWPLITVLLLLPLVAWLAARALRPVLERLSSQAEELERSAGELRLAGSVFEGTGEAIMITSPNHRILRVNPAFTRITGFGAEEVLGRPMSDLFELDDRENRKLERICQDLRRDNSWQGELDYRNRRGERLTALQTISRVTDEEGRVSHFIHIFNDITETKAAEKRIRHQARHDPLTDLPNRASLKYRIARAVGRAGREQTSVALLFLDLDYFKEVNDRLGHAVGDQLLQEVAARLQRLLRHEDVVGRLGGDEFLILLEGLPEARFAGDVARKVIEVLTRPFDLDGESVSIGVSIGIAVYPEQGDDAETLVHHADAAMYEAKAAGRDTYRFYDDATGQAPSCEGDRRRS